MGWRNRLLNASPDTVGRAMKFGGGRILSQQDLPRAGMNKGGRATKNIYSEPKSITTNVPNNNTMKRLVFHRFCHFMIVFNYR